MADSTRFKDLQAECKQLSEQVRRKETATDEKLINIESVIEEKMTKMESNTNARLERIEAAIEALARVPDARMEKMEYAVSTMMKDHHAQHDTITRLSQIMVIRASGSGKEAITYGGPQQPHFTKQVKIDFPRFDGTDPSNWIFCAEQYFAYYETPDPHRLVLAAINMEGDVVPWYQML